MPSLPRAPATIGRVARVDDIAGGVEGRPERGRRSGRCGQCDRRACRFRLSSRSPPPRTCRRSRRRRRRRCLRRSVRRSRPSCCRVAARAHHGLTSGLPPTGRSKAPRPERSARRRRRTGSRLSALRRYFITPLAASSPKALPPANTIACTCSTRLDGSSRSVSRVPGADPRTATPLPSRPSRRARRCIRWGVRSACDGPTRMPSIRCRCPPRASSSAVMGSRAACPVTIEGVSGATDQCAISTATGRSRLDTHSSETLYPRMRILRAGLSRQSRP